MCCQPLAGASSRLPVSSKRAMLECNLNKVMIDSSTSGLNLYHCGPISCVLVRHLETQANSSLEWEAEIYYFRDPHCGQEIENLVLEFSDPSQTWARFKWVHQICITLAVVVLC